MQIPLRSAERERRGLGQKRVLREGFSFDNYNVV